MGCGDSTGLDITALNGSSGNLVTGDRCGNDLIRGNGCCGNLLGGNRPSHNDRAVDLLPVFLILQFLYRKSGCFSVDLIDQSVYAGDNQALSCQGA